MNQTEEKQQVAAPVQAPKGNTPKSCSSNIWTKVKILSFLGALVLCFVLGLCFFLRPTFSENEKRPLAQFPQFTWESFASGEYFSDISLWYADTFPAREFLISVNQGIRELFGVRTVQIIPSSPVTPNPSAPGNSSDPATPEDNTPIEQLGGVYLKGSSAYEIYKQSAANSARYAELIKEAAASLAGKATVYDMIIPLSSSVNLSEKELKSIGASDAAAAINSMYAAMEGVHTVDVYSALLEHKDEYLYFRTDHHWTARGAYYAYVRFCEVKGLTPMPLSTWQKYEFGGFLGTLYNEAKQPAALKNNPDTVEAWVPNGTNDIRVTDKSGTTLKYTGGLVRKDTDTFYQNAGSKYNCFLMGDAPLVTIHNEAVTDGSSIIVVKESFGNAMVPFLVDHYEHIYVVDYRYFTNTTHQSLSEFVDETGANTVLFVNNLTATSASPRLDELQRLIEG